MSSPDPEAQVRQNVVGAERLAQLRQQRSDVGPGDLRQLGGNGTSGGMDGGRLDRLEIRMDHVETRLDNIDRKMDDVIKGLQEANRTLSYLSGKVDNLPTTVQLLGFAVAVIVASGLLSYFGK